MNLKWARFIQGRSCRLGIVSAEWFDLAGNSDGWYTHSRVRNLLRVHHHFAHETLVQPTRMLALQLKSVNNPCCLRQLRDFNKLYLTVFVSNSLLAPGKHSYPGMLFRQER